MTPAPDGPPPLADPTRPTLVLPRGACDGHCHIYGPFDRFPLPDDRSFTPNEAPETALRHLHDHLGIDRAVIVQSTGHGFDHRPLLAALATGAGRYRGVALVKPSTDPGELRRFHDAGVRGVRFNFLAHLGGGPSLDAMRQVMALTRPFGWHVAIHVAGRDVVHHADFIRSIEAPVVIDHMARPDIGEGPDGPAAMALRRLLDTGRVWVKLSGADRLTKAGAPFDDVVPFAQALAAHAPDRVLWGSDWPHVNLHGPMPDDGVLTDLIGRIVPDAAARHRMLVDNPARFFDFA
jgi:predicted TIM-barrel fold metal-dependent hydrolase